MSDFGSGHDLTVRGFEPHVGLCADSSEPGACFGFCALCLSKINKCNKEIFFFNNKVLDGTCDWIGRVKVTRNKSAVITR